MKNTDEKSKKIDNTSVIVFTMWMITFILTGVVYYSSVYGGSKEQHSVSAMKKEGTLNDKLRGKKIVGFGDSIMHGTGTEGISLTQIIAEKYGMEFKDFSMGGATVASIDREKSKANLNMLEQIKRLKNEVEHTDYIIFDGGTNDIADKLNIPMGIITESYKEPRDITTYCGGFEEILSELKAKYPKAKIIYVRTHIMDRRQYQKQLLFGEEAVKICQKWGIECVDLFKNSEMNTYLDRYATYTCKTLSYPNGDKVHPTFEGYELFYLPYIEKALKNVTTN